MIDTHVEGVGAFWKILRVEDGATTVSDVPVTKSDGTRSWVAADVEDGRVSAAAKVATAAYTGYMAELDNVRNALRAWALTSGYEVVDRPYESYKSGVAGAFTENGEFDVYWVLKSK